MKQSIIVGLAIWLLALGLDNHATGQIHPVVKRDSAGIRVQIQDRDQVVFEPIPVEGFLRVIQPSGETAVSYPHSDSTDDKLNLTGGRSSGLHLSESYRSVNPALIVRTVTVTAESDQRYFIDFGWKTGGGKYCSFQSEEPVSASYSPGCGGPEFGGQSHQTFPFLGVKQGEVLYGVIGDTPGHWENRSFMRFDVENRILSLTNGDGSPKRVLEFPHNLDATTVYRARFDGWQRIEAGETQTWTTWIFRSPARSQYDVQLAAHLALANGKGFNSSGLEAILRNTSYLLLRRNLLRPESDYIFISGVGYGWKQWVTDGFWMSRGLNDPKIDAEAHAAMFFERIHYEDNAQVYLIWAALVKRAGGRLDQRTLGRAYRFMRQHEVDGLFVPPCLKHDSKGFKTYMDILEYEDDDAPSSNQGFHCGALMAARELGFEVTEEDIDKAIAGYRRMFNSNGKYFATSLLQQDRIGQDALYGEVLTYAVFGRKVLPDEMVREHLETTYRLQSPYGMRVISKANGDLLDGHSGSYVFGGSWFLVDGANYLAGLMHGLDPMDLDARLLWRLEKELAFMPAFHESINTLDGKPHGHHLYSWNSGFWWLRQEVRAQLGITGADPIHAMLDRKLGIERENDALVLNSERATLRPFPHDGFTSLFDGKTLEGWQAADMSFWRVEDGAITAEIAEAKPTGRNHYLVYQGGNLGDFELKVNHRILSEHEVNGGFQFRSEIFNGDIPDDCRGYQVDNNTQTDWLVRLYDEFGRHTLAWRGERTVFQEDSEKVTTPIESAQGPAKFNLAEWHAYHLTCIGETLTLKVNGDLVAEVVDNDPKQQDFSGILALQLHSGPPMKVQFKDIQLRILE